MNRMKIGIMVDSLRMGVKDGIRRARELGAEGVQIYAVSGSFTPDQLSEADIEGYRRLLEENGLAVAALCGDFGGHGFQNREENASRVERSKRIMDLACALGSRVVTTHIGVIPEDRSDPAYGVMRDACCALAEYAEKKDAYFAVETGPELPEVMLDFLKSIGYRGVAVNYDPANLVMVHNCDPVAGVYTLRDYIVHTHAKDGVFKKACDPVKIYESFAIENLGGLDILQYFEETPLGAGQVDFPTYLAALKACGYEGFLTIEREVGDDPARDISLAVDFLRAQAL